MKTVYPPKDCKPRTLTHDEIVRVDAFSMGPADFYEQRHARYDRERMRKILERELPEEKLRRVGVLQKFDEETYELEKHGRTDVGSLGPIAFAQKITNPTHGQWVDYSDPFYQQRGYNRPE